MQTSLLSIVTMRAVLLKKTETCNCSKFTKPLNTGKQQTKSLKTFCLKPWNINTCKVLNLLFRKLLRATATCTNIVYMPPATCVNIILPSYDIASPEPISNTNKWNLLNRFLFDMCYRYIKVFQLSEQYPHTCADDFYYERLKAKLKHTKLVKDPIK